MAAPVIWRAARPPAAATRTLVTAGHPPRLARLLAQRGVTTAESASAFLEPGVERLTEPRELTGLEAAVTRLQHAASRKEAVFVVGDYDVDGISASALLQAVLQSCGIPCVVQLPSRRQHGYGLHPSFVERAAREGASILLAVDCGSNAPQPIAEALSAGLDVIVLDHHLPECELPATVLHVNPQFEAAASPFRDLSAAGIAFELSRALSSRLGHRLDPARLASVACLGTICDMVPLRGENRVLTAIGLATLADTGSVGLRALIARAGIRPPIAAHDVAFGLGPRLNAPGRMAEPDPALRLLLSREPAAAAALADELEGFNRQRREEEARVTEAARSRFDPDALPGILVAWDRDWHPGVLGIAAGRLARQLGRPAVLLALGGNGATGSGRSVAGIDLHAFLARWSGRLQRFGGHPQAVGLTADAQLLETLRGEWEAEADWPPESLTQVLEYEVHETAAGLTPELLTELERLRPWGQDCPEPLIRLDALQSLAEPRAFGNGHLEARAAAAGAGVRLIGWRWSSRASDLSGRFDVLGFLERDNWNGGLRVRLADARPAGAE